MAPHDRNLRNVGYKTSEGAIGATGESRDKRFIDAINALILIVSVLALLIFATIMHRCIKSGKS
jgi:hypothetical protein